MRLKPVLLLPRTCFGEMAPPFARGFEGRPSAAKVLRGGTGATALSSSGVGGNWFTAGAMCRCSFACDPTSSSFTRADNTSDELDAWLSTLFFRGAEVGGNGPPFPPRGPVPSSAKLLNFFTAGTGRAFRFTDGAASTVAGLSGCLCSSSPCERSESLRASSLCDFDCWRPMADCVFDLRSDFAGGGGGGGEGNSLPPYWFEIGNVCARAESAGVGGTIAVEPLLVMRLSDGGFASRDRLLKGIFLLDRCAGEAVRALLGDRGASSMTASC